MKKPRGLAAASGGAVKWPHRTAAGDRERWRTNLQPGLFDDDPDAARAPAVPREAPAARRGAGVDAQSDATGAAPVRPGGAVARRAPGAAGLGVGRAGGLEPACTRGIRAVEGGSGRTADRPGDPVCPVAVCHAGRGGQRAGAGAADPGARRLPLDLRRGAGQLPHPVGFPHAPMARRSTPC